MAEIDQGSWVRLPSDGSEMRQAYPPVRCVLECWTVPLCLFATVYHCVLRVACVRGQRFLGAVTSGVG